MRFDRDVHGAWLVDPDELAHRLGVTASHLQSQALRGLVTSSVETGSGEDQGRSRVTVSACGTTWQGVFDQQGSLISECAFPVQRN